MKKISISIALEAELQGPLQGPTLSSSLQLNVVLTIQGDSFLILEAILTSMKSNENQEKKN